MPLNLRPLFYLSVLATMLAAACSSPPEPPPLTLSSQAWTQQRLETIGALYGITPGGMEALQGLDIRQMVGQPGYFGSFGFFDWTGVGEAKPIQVVHEISHAYWGAFPIEGLPDLSWRAPQGGGISPAMERYHQDVLTFMAQPPDEYEPLRQRLRLLPKLAQDNTGPLFHTMEADLVYTVAGDLDLVPPILRKYWVNLLAPGPFRSWSEALAWYQSLSSEERADANRFIGFEHLDLRSYQSLETAEDAGLEESLVELVQREQRQRLTDFVQQLDLLLEPSEDKEDSKFWRGYLGDKVALNSLYPELIPSLDHPRALEIAQALGILSQEDNSSPLERAREIKAGMEEVPLLVFFLPVLDNATLLALSETGVEIPSEATLGGLSEFVGLLKDLTPVVQRVLEKGGSDPEEGARELGSYLVGVDFKGQKEELELFLELLQSGDRQVTSKVVSALDDKTLARLLEPVPVPLRFILEPPRLLQALNIAQEAREEDLARGIGRLMVNTAGNFRIDEPFVQEMCRVVAERGRRDPLGTLKTIQGTKFPMENFLLKFPQDASRILASDLEVAAKLVLTSDAVTFPPARFVYRLISADPELAARVVRRLEADEHRDLVLEALAFFAYDAHRLSQVPSLPISLEADGRFLSELVGLMGGSWLEQRLSETIDVYRDRVAQGDAPPNFLEAYGETLRAAADTLGDGEVGEELRRILEAAGLGD